MRRQIGKRAVKPQQDPEKLETVKFIEENTQNNLGLRRDHIYLEDVKTAININTLEQNIILRKKIIKLLESNMTKDMLIKRLQELQEMDEHRLKKHCDKSISL